jgi:glycosyltransferase domain-containing protein
MKLGIVIPTMNRAELLLGQLFFYDSFGIGIAVYIGDSSKESEKDAIGRGIKELKHVVVHLVDFPTSVPQAKVIVDLVDRVQEEFITISGDDDYHVLPQSLECLRFLQNNPTYACCTGTVAMAETQLVHGVREIVGVSDYSPQGPIDSDDALERMKGLAKSYYLPLFCIGRKKDFVEAFKSEKNIKSNIIWAETLPAFKLVAIGKLQVLDGLAMIRGTHAMRPIYNNKLKDTFLSEDWTSSLFAAIDSIALLLENKLPGQKLLKSEVQEIFSDYYTQQISRNNCEPKASLRARIPPFMKALLRKIYYRLASDKLNSGSVHKYSKFYAVFNRLNESFKKSGR